MVFGLQKSVQSQTDANPLRFVSVGLVLAPGNCLLNGSKSGGGGFNSPLLPALNLGDWGG